MIVNEGVNYVPHLIREIRDPYREKVIETKEPVRSQQHIHKKGDISESKGVDEGVITKGTAKGCSDYKSGTRWQARTVREK
jgi:cell division protein FtsI/penicillin-binding protein 2